MAGWNSEGTELEGSKSEKTQKRKKKNKDDSIRKHEDEGSTAWRSMRTPNLDGKNSTKDRAIGGRRRSIPQILSGKARRRGGKPLVSSSAQNKRRTGYSLNTSPLSVKTGEIGPTHGHPVPKKRNEVTKSTESKNLRKERKQNTRGQRRGDLIYSVRGDSLKSRSFSN